MQHYDLYDALFIPPAFTDEVIAISMRQSPIDCRKYFIEFKSTII